MYLFNVIFEVMLLCFILALKLRQYTIVMSAFAELGIHTGFIVWKAKVENCGKYPNVKSN